MGLLAFCVSQMVHAVRLPHERQSDPRFKAADQLAKALSLDMADWWTPTAEGYLGTIKKVRFLKRTRRGRVKQTSRGWASLKKGELAAAAEERLAQSRGLPEILQSR